MAKESRRAGRTGRSARCGQRPCRGTCNRRPDAATGACPALRRCTVSLLPGRLLRIDRPARGFQGLRSIDAAVRRGGAAVRRAVPLARAAQRSDPDLRSTVVRERAAGDQRSCALLPRTHRLPARLLRRGIAEPRANSRCAAGRSRGRAQAAHSQRADGAGPLWRGRERVARLGRRHAALALWALQSRCRADP
jgi:hypothetical protein